MREEDEEEEKGESIGGRRRMRKRWRKLEGEERENSENG